LTYLLLGIGQRRAAASVCGLRHLRAVVVHSVGMMFLSSYFRSYLLYCV